MKNLVNFISENQVDDQIDKLMSMMNTLEDVEALGESFGKKYSSWIGHALNEFLYGVAFVQKDSDIKRAIEKLSNAAENIESKEDNK